MRKYFLLLLILLFCAGCGNDVPERFAGVGDAVFGKSDYDREQVLSEFTVSRLPLELSVSPVSGTVWRISLIFPAKTVSPEKVKGFAREYFSLEFGKSDIISLPGTDIRILPAFDFGPQAKKIVFTDREYEKIYRQENISPEAEDIRCIRRAKKEVLILESAVSEYYNETGRYPESVGDLLTDPGVPNWQGPYLPDRSLLTDPWGRSYRYLRRKDGFTVFSTGSSGQEQLR